MPISIRIAHKDGLSEIRQSLRQFWQRRSGDYSAVSSKTDDEPSEDPLSASQTGLISRRSSLGLLTKKYTPEGVLSLSETARLSLEFCMLWFLANYLVAACLEYTSVASSTILTSTSSIWTLLFGALVRVEQFSWKKFTGVMASLAGIILISTVDLSRKDNDDNRGNFPHKSKSEIALGDAMAFGSAVMYGIYAVVMKKRIGNEDRVNMPLFFGLVGLFNMVLLWPGFFILHFTGIEKFELPPTKKVAAIVLVSLFLSLPITPDPTMNSNSHSAQQSNSTASFISDYCWAYAMLLTTPLVTTVGLSLTIPLSLIGQMILSHQYSSALYWVGALIVLLSFLFINHESKEEVEPPQARDLDVVV